MKKFNFLALLAVSGMFSACTDTLENIPENDKKLIDIVVSGGVHYTDTRVIYDPNEEKTAYIASWEQGDEISVFVPNTEGNDNHKFTITTTAKTSDMSGRIAAWEEGKNLYAIYPYAIDGYTFNTTDSTILFDNTAQKVDALAGNEYMNGLMVAVAANSTVTAEGEYSIGELKFKQIMSLFELEVKDIPEGERITSMGFEVGEQLFAASADINPTTGEIVARTNTNSVSAIVNNQSGTTASLNFSVLPVDLTGKPVSLYLTTISATTSKKYKYEITAGINFQANRFLYNDDGALSLTTDFEEAGVGILYLADFKEGFVPEGEKWVIADETATSISFDGLKNSLIALGEAGRTIVLEFPSLTVLPNEALNSSGNVVTSISCPKASSIGNSAFYYCSALTTVSLPVATSIGNSAFYSCSALTTVSLPVATSIGENAFNSCNALTEVSLPVANSIKYRTFAYCNSLSSVSSPMATEIGVWAFHGCYALTNISLPMATVISSAFNECYALTTVSLPVATAIESSAFNECYALTSVSLPQATSIGNSAFYSCSALTTVSLPVATSIEAGAFSSCSALTTVSLPMATSIESSLFNGCIALTSASFPMATSIGSEAFYACDALRNLEVATGIDATTGEGLVLADIRTDIFKITDAVTNEGNVTLTIGLANQPNIQTNTLTVLDYYDSPTSYTFKKIILIGGSDSDIPGSIEDGIPEPW